MLLSYFPPRIFSFWIGSGVRPDIYTIIQLHQRRGLWGNVLNICEKSKQNCLMFCSRKIHKHTFHLVFYIPHTNCIWNFRGWWKWPKTRKTVWAMKRSMVEVVSNLTMCNKANLLHMTNPHTWRNGREWTDTRFPIWLPFLRSDHISVIQLVPSSKQDFSLTLALWLQRW